MGCRGAGVGGAFSPLIQFVKKLDETKTKRTNEGKSQIILSTDHEYNTLADG